MSILEKLSSQVADRSQQSNQQVVSACFDNPALLEEIATGLSASQAGLVGDCAEVLCQVASQQPRLVQHYSSALWPLLQHKTTRVRWEAAHALALLADCAPAAIKSLLPGLGEIFRTDVSIIVRDYIADCIANYAGTSPDAAQEAYPLLKEFLDAYGGKHAGHALHGLVNVAGMLPELRPELGRIAKENVRVHKAVVRKAALELQKATRPVG